MLEALREQSKLIIGRGPCRATVGVILALLFLLTLASGANAQLLTCTDCHGTSPHAGGASVDNCASCHTKVLNHPTGPVTPGPVTDSASCKMCHLAGGQVVHQKIAVDIDKTCGQCHGGGTVQSSMTGTLVTGTPYKTSDQLAAQAKWMHTGGECLTPTATSTIGVVGNVVTLTDTSTNVMGLVTINWGDGNSAMMSAGTSTSHTYASRVATYTIKQTTTGNCDLTASKIVKQAVAPAKYTISVTVTGVGSNVTLALKKKGTSSKMSTIAVLNNVNHSATFSVAEGIYSVSCAGGTTGLFTVPATTAVSLSCN